MVDFSKLIAQKNSEKPVDPIVIYDRLDRASDKGELRKSQEIILNAWHKSHRVDRDVIVKLHTGQGKTLIGLLMLQSKLNEGKGPALYLCPTTQLAEQTCEQARQFGISVVTSTEDSPAIPAEFSECKAIYVTTASKLFNGKTRFKLHGHSLKAGAVLLDDSHACVDAIRESVSIRVPAKFKFPDKEAVANPVFDKLLEFFSPELQTQGAGTLEDIKNGSRDALLPVPYWAWSDKANEVTKILAGYADNDWLKFKWPILKDKLKDCLCVVSGTGMEIVPYLAPLEIFGTYWDAGHRIFMSATVTDDSFLIKGLRLLRKTILEPLVYPAEKWSGEKMILVPSLIQDDLDRDTIVGIFAKDNPTRNYGQVTLVPSFARALDWENAGARVAKGNIDATLADLKSGARSRTIVFANRYDGIDLPDELCRVLIFDSLPYGESLYDKYLEQCRPGSSLQSIRIARSIEQGLGRSVRGEKDYSVIIITGPELVDFLRQRQTRDFLSDQTKKQVEIGINVSGLARNETKPDVSSAAILRSVLQQCLKRDEQWKEYYRQEMDSIVPAATTNHGIEAFEAELKAETLFENNDPEGAIACLQKYLDKNQVRDKELAFYMQEIARYAYSWRKSEAIRYQILAHSKNRLLLMPTEGRHVETLNPLAGERIANIVKWVKSFESIEQLKISLDDICARFSFGVESNEFERAVQQIGTALGFSSERPDKEWKQGPDNLWCLRDGDYLLIECKNEVRERRDEINKHEVSQMNTSIAWFRQNYDRRDFSRLMVIGTNRVAAASVFSDEVGIMTSSELNRLKKKLREFFNEFGAYDLKSIDEGKVDRWLVQHKLSIDDIKAGYQKAVVSA